MPGIFVAPAVEVRELLFFWRLRIGLQLLILALEVHMNRLLVALGSAVLLAVAGGPSVFAFTPQQTAASCALSWLHTNQSSDGTVGNDATRTEETVWGLAANNASIANFATDGKTTIDSLRSHVASEEATAGNIGSLILAVRAANLDPNDFAGRNLLNDLAATYNASTGAYNNQLYSDALAVLSIPDGAAPQKAVDYLIAAQQPDGGWEFNSGWGSDTNTTSVVLMALKANGGLSTTVKTKALAYLRKVQLELTNGGFEYSSGSGDSDPDSDGMVIQGLLAAGQDPTSAAWSVGQKNALSDLLTFQYTNGGFGYYRPGSKAGAAPDLLSTTQPLVGLASTYLPVRAAGSTTPTTCTAATGTSPTPQSTPSAAPTAPGTIRLAQTGESPVPAFVLFFAALFLITLGWRLRRRHQ
jgi:hypothetical protein